MANLLEQNIEYTFNINKIYFDLSDKITSFDYELRMFLGEDASEAETSCGEYKFKTPIQRSADLLSSIVDAIKKEQSIDDIEKSDIFENVSSLLKTRKSISCSISLTNII